MKTRLDLTHKNANLKSNIRHLKIHKNTIGFKT